MVLEVEERESQAEGYGKGTPKLRMSFGECLRRMASGDTSLYLTTQKVRRQGHSLPAAFSSLGAITEPAAGLSAARADCIPPGSAPSPS